MPIAESGDKLSINLPNQTISEYEGSILVDHFEIEQFRKESLIAGLDDITLTLQLEDRITEYENFRKTHFSFLEGGSKLLEFSINFWKQKLGSLLSLCYNMNYQEW